MITFLILIFTVLNSPLIWGKPLLPFFCYGVGIVITGFVAGNMVRGQIPLTPLDFPLLLLGLVALVSSWISIWRLGSQVRVLTIISYIAAFYFIYLWVDEETLTHNVIRAGWVLIAAYLALGVNWLWFLPNGLNDLGNRNVLASILLLTLPFGARIPDKRWRWRWVWFVAGSVAMVLTKSRGGLLGLAMAVGLLLGIDKRLIIGASVVSLPALFLWKKGTAMIRLCYWRSAFQAWWAHPWLGIGPASCIKFISPLCGQKVPHAHNIVLTFLAEMGLAGLVVLGLLLWQIWQHCRPGPAGAALAGFMVHSLVDDPIWFWAPGLGVMSLLAIMIRRGQRNGE